MFSEAFFVSNRYELALLAIYYVCQMYFLKLKYMDLRSFHKIDGGPIFENSNLVESNNKKLFVNRYSVFIFSQFCIKLSKAYSKLC